MAGPVQETSPQQQATKRSAEADPEPSPVPKRLAEDLTSKQQEQPANATPAPEQQPAGQSEGSTAHEPAAQNQSGSAEASDGKVAEHPPPSAQSEAQTKEVKGADNIGSDLAAVASKLAADVTAVLEKTQKVAKIAVEATTAEGVPAEQNTVEPTVKKSEPPSETNPAVPQESVKPTGADSSTETKPRDAAPEAPAQPIVEKITEAVPEKGPEATKLVNNVNVDVKAPVQKPDPVSQTAVAPPAPPLATLTPANPLPQTASTPLIGNVPPQAVESLQAAAQEGASILPLQQPTQELLEQQATIRTTPVNQPVDQGVAPMEE